MVGRVVVTFCSFSTGRPRPFDASAALSRTAYSGNSSHRFSARGHNNNGRNNNACDGFPVTIIPRALMNVCGNEGQPATAASQRGVMPRPGAAGGSAGGSESPRRRAKAGPHLDYILHPLRHARAVHHGPSPGWQDMEFVCQRSSPVFKDVSDDDSTHTAPSLPPASPWPPPVGRLGWQSTSVAHARRHPKRTNPPMTQPPGLSTLLDDEGATRGRYRAAPLFLRLARGFLAWTIEMTTGLEGEGIPLGKN